MKTINQSEMAKIMGISAPRLSIYRSGMGGMFRVKTLLKMQRRTGIEWTRFVTEKPKVIINELQEKYGKVRQWKRKD